MRGTCRPETLRPSRLGRPRRRRRAPRRYHGIAQRRSKPRRLQSSNLRRGEHLRRRAIMQIFRYPPFLPLGPARRTDEVCRGRRWRRRGRGLLLLPLRRRSRRIPRVRVNRMCSGLLRGRRRRVRRLHGLRRRHRDQGQRRQVRYRSPLRTVRRVARPTGVTTTTCR